MGFFSLGTLRPRRGLDSRRRCPSSSLDFAAQLRTASSPCCSSPRSSATSRRRAGSSATAASSSTRSGGAFSCTATTGCSTSYPAPGDRTPTGCPVPIENAIPAHALKHPTHGAQRVADELMLRGIQVSSGGVRGVWMRNDLLTHPSPPPVFCHRHVHGPPEIRQGSESDSRCWRYFIKPNAGGHQLAAERVG